MRFRFRRARRINSPGARIRIRADVADARRVARCATARQVQWRVLVARRVAARVRGPEAVAARRVDALVLLWPALLPHRACLVRRAADDPPRVRRRRWEGRRPEGFTITRVTGRRRAACPSYPLGEYDPYGNLNRVSYDKESSHSVTVASGPNLISSISQPTMGLNEDLRVHVAAFDPNCNGYGGNVVAYAQLLTPGGYYWTQGTCHLSNTWFGWLPSSNGTGTLNIQSNQAATMWGVIFDSYEYRRYASGTTPFWTPLRFPGQYHDEETDLNQNWNRFYEPLTGRYLEPEPLAQTPYPAFAGAYSGTQWPVYAYAANDPINFVDVDGLTFLNPTPAEQGAIGRLEANPLIGAMVRDLDQRKDVVIKLGEVNPGDFLYSDLLWSGGSATIFQPRECSESNPAQANVLYNVQASNAILKAQFGLDTNLDEALAHELGHVHHELGIYKNQSLLTTLMDLDSTNSYSNNLDAALHYEGESVSWENAVRFPGPLRPHY